MIKYFCDICEKEITGLDDYIVINRELNICSRKCGYNWIDEQFKMTKTKEGLHP